MIPDISVIIPYNNFNESILNAIEYCKNRGVTTEIIHEPQEAKGEFVVSIDSFTYYYDYYLHYQYVALIFMKDSNKCDQFVFKYITVCENLEFYTGDYTFQKFTRRIPEFKGKVFIESRIVPGATLLKLKEMQHPVPVDLELIRYRTYFKDNNLLNSKWIKNQEEDLKKL